MRRKGTGAANAPIALHLIIGVVWATLAGLADALVAALGPPTGASASQHALAGAAIVSMYLPVGLVSGLAVGLAVAALRRVRWLRSIGSWLLSPRQLFLARPEAFGNALAGLFAMAFFVGALTWVGHTIFTSYHAPWLAAAATAIAATVVACGAVLVYGVAGLATRRIADAAPLLARPILVLLLFSVLAIAVALRVHETWPTVFVTYDPLRVFWVPAMGVAYVLVAVAVVGIVRRTSPRVGPERALAAILAVVALVAIGSCALTYGSDPRARAVVEERSVGGRALLRSYLGATDRDADGFSFAFGGGDCDDADPYVYPGSYDPPGDGVDSDCFGGDGAPDIGVIGRAGFAPRPAGLLAHPNVLLLSVDALRPDHLGCFGYARPTSTNIDRFAGQSVRFERVMAQSSRSIRSIPSMMTGLYPSQIAFGNELPRTSVHAENELLAELLSRRGYQTRAVVGTRYFDRSHGFFQGFDSVVTIEDAASSRSIVADRGLDALRELSSGERPFFLWVHLFNVHQPYLSRTETSRFGQEPVDLYDEEIVLADEQLGRILEALGELGLDDSTIVIVASDHGEAFGEHGTSGHSETLYEEELRSVLMMRVPSVAARDVSTRVGLFDLTPTVLNLVGAPEPTEVPSRSLVGLMTGASPPEDRAMLGELMPDGHQPFDRKSITMGRYKLQWWVRENRYELYDLVSDPGELHELSADDPERARELIGALRAWTSSNSRPENRREAAIAEDRLPGPPARLQHRLDLPFQGIFTLLGYDLHGNSANPGGPIAIDFYYRVDDETERNLLFVFDAAPPPGHPSLHHMRTEHYPLNGRYFTNEWRQGEILRDRVTLVLPDEVRIGAELRLSLTIREGGRAQAFADGRTVVSLGTVRVVAPIDGTPRHGPEPTPSPPGPASP